MRRVESHVTFLVVCLLLCGSVTSYAAGDPVSRELFGKHPGAESDVNPLMEKMQSGDRTIMRSRPVSVYFDVMRGGQADPSPAGRLQLNLFPDTAFTAVFDRLERNPSGSLSWIGHLEGMERSQVILVHHNGLMAGNISLPGAFYQVRYVDNGIHSVRQIDQSKFPDNDDVAIPMEPDAKPVPDARVAMKDDGSIIDVLVVYTPSARSIVGGTSAMNTLVDLAITETNTSYQNSGISQRVRLVYKGEVSYTEQSFSADLNNLTNTTDGYMDDVHTLRSQYGADEVVLLINEPSSCGLAWLMTTVSTSFKTSAFGVVEQSCATGNYSFGHELGHNMGARHDRYVDTSNTPYDTSHGYVNVSNRWRTIMAYNNQCSASGTNCTRLQYWSNPNVTYQGNVMGVATGNSNAADNRSTLNNTAFTVANFMDSTISTSVPASLAISGSSSVTGGSSSTYTATVTFTNGTTSTVTPTWSVSPTTNATISTGGVLTTTTVTSTQTVTITATYTLNGATVSSTKTVSITSAPVLSSIAISGASSVNGGSSTTFGVTATFTDGSTSSVTPTWSVSPGTYASISSGGILTTTSVRAVQSITVTASYTTGGVTKTDSKTVKINPATGLSPLARRTSIFSPYWQADASSYSFISVGLPSLAGMASQVGISVTAVGRDGIAQGISEFTVSMNSISKLFIAGTNSAYINPTNLPNDNLMILGSDPASGHLRFTPLATNSEAITSSGGNTDGPRLINQLTLWGAVVNQSSNTGFAMEFVGDLADSRNPVRGAVIATGVN